MSYPGPQRPRVYLSGPMTGLNHDIARGGWRRDMSVLLGPDIHCVSPMRGWPQARGPVLRTGGECYITNPSASTARDRFDVQHCDVMVCNLLGATQITQGTMIEVGWADAWRRPVVLCMEPVGNIHDHALLTGIAATRVTQLEDAAQFIRALLLGSL